MWNPDQIKMPPAESFESLMRFLPRASQSAQVGTAAPAAINFRPAAPVSLRTRETGLSCQMARISVPHLRFLWVYQPIISVARHPEATA
jgi:hypothetical protein